MASQDKNALRMVASSDGAKAPAPLDGVSEFLLPGLMRDLLERLHQELLQPWRAEVEACMRNHHNAQDEIDRRYQVRINTIEEGWGRTQERLSKRETELTQARDAAHNSYRSVQVMVDDLRKDMELRYSYAMYHCRNLGAKARAFEPTASRTISHAAGSPEVPSRPFKTASDYIRCLEVTVSDHKRCIEKAVANIKLIPVDPNPFVLSSPNKGLIKVICALLSLPLWVVITAMLWYAYPPPVYSGIMTPAPCCTFFIVPAIVYLVIVQVVHGMRRVDASNIAKTLRNLMQDAHEFTESSQQAAKERLDAELAGFDLEAQSLATEYHTCLAEKTRLLDMEKQEHTSAIETRNQYHSDTLSTLRAKRASVLPRFHNEVRLFWQLCALAGSGWEDDSWQSWCPDESPEFAARIGRFVVDTRDLEERFPGLNLRFELPALIPFAEGKCLMICGGKS